MTWRWDDRYEVLWVSADQGREVHVWQRRDGRWSVSLMDGADHVYVGDYPSKDDALKVGEMLNGWRRTASGWSHDMFTVTSEENGWMLHVCTARRMWKQGPYRQMGDAVQVSAAIYEASL